MASPDSPEQGGGPAFCWETRPREEQGLAPRHSAGEAEPRPSTRIAVGRSSFPSRDTGRWGRGRRCGGAEPDQEGKRR